MFTHIVVGVVVVVVMVVVVEMYLLIVVVLGVNPWGWTLQVSKVWQGQDTL